MEYLNGNGFKEKSAEDVLACYEHVYEDNDITCMDVYIYVDSVTKAKVFNNFS